MSSINNPSINQLIPDTELLELTHRLAETQATLQGLVNDQIETLNGADQPGAAALRAAQQQLHQVNELLSAVFNGMHSCIAYLDRDFNFLRVNNAYAAADGRPTEAYTGRNHFELFPNPENEAIFRSVVKTKKPYNVTNRAFENQSNPERGVTYWDWSLQPILDPTGEVEGLVLILTDVTERIATELTLLEQTELISLLQDIAVASNEAHSVEEVYLRAIDRICVYTGWPVGHGLLLNRAGNLASTRIWHVQNEQEYASFVAQTQAIEWAHGAGVPGKVLETGQAAWFSDVTGETGFVRQEAAHQAGLHACFALPVLIGREVVGLLEFFSREAIVPNPHFLESLQQIGAQLGRVVERQRAESHLQYQQALLSEVLNRLPVGVWVADEQGNIILGNPAGIQIWAGARYVGIEQFGEYKGWRLDTGELIEAHDWALARAIEHGETTLDELIEIQCFDGSHKIILNSAIPLRNDRGEFSGAIVVIQDISERRQMEADLAEVQRRLLDNLEAERARLAQELHDGPMQDLYGLRFQLQTVEDDLFGRATQNHVAETRDTLQSVIYTLRAICTDLRPPALAPFGLEKAIRSYVDGFAEKYPALHFHLELQPDGQSVAESTRLALYRNCQQLLTNVVRHADARNVWVRLALADHTLSLEVQDDGLGFNPSQRPIELARLGNLGLIGATERAEALGGRLEIDSQPGQGTTVRTIVPL